MAVANGPGLDGRASARRLCSNLFFGTIRVELPLVYHLTAGIGRRHRGGKTLAISPKQKPASPIRRVTAINACAPGRVLPL